MVASGPYRVIVSPRAFDDLDEILDYVKQVSPANAAKVIDRLWAAVQRLNEMPHRYRVVQAMSRPSRAVRRMPVRPYLVYYRIDEAFHVVRVLTILHGHRRQPRRFR
jgi:toxin ParE1/3/4